jgi:hypothetical protein
MTMPPSALVALGRRPDGVLVVGHVGETPQDVVTRGSDDESRCARYVYGGAVVKPGDKEACVSYWESLKAQPIDTVAHTLAVYVAGEQLIAGTLCSSVLATNPWGWAGCTIAGHFLGGTIGGWITGALVSLGLKDCRDDGPGKPEMTLRLWSALQQANAEGAHVFSDPEAPLAFWALCVNTANIAVDDGLENCRDGDWWKGWQAHFDADVAAVAQQSAERGAAIVQARAAELARAEGPGCSAAPESPECKRVLQAAFAVALADNALATEREVLRLQSNIAHYAPGTLQPTTDEAAAWQSSALRAQIDQKTATAKTKSAELFEDARNGTGPWGISRWWYVAGAAVLAGVVGYVYRKPLGRAATKAKKKIRRIVR